MTSIFGPALQKYTSQLITRISEEYKIPVDEMNAKYMTTPIAIIKPKVPRKPKEPITERTMCPFLCGNKKTPCKNKCISNGTGCHLHDPNRVQTPKPPKEPKLPKVLKGESLTSDSVTAFAIAAEAVRTDPILNSWAADEGEIDVEDEPLGDESIHDRLRAMLAEEELEDFGEDE